MLKWRKEQGSGRKEQIYESFLKWLIIMFKPRPCNKNGVKELTPFFYGTTFKPPVIAAFSADFFPEGLREQADNII